MRDLESSISWNHNFAYDDDKRATIPICTNKKLLFSFLVPHHQRGVAKPALNLHSKRAAEDGGAQLFHRTCRFSQDLDLELMDHTLLRILRTRRLAEVREPRYTRGPQLPNGERLRFFTLNWSLGMLGSGGLSSFKRIWVRMPTSSSSTL